MSKERSSHRAPVKKQRKLQPAQGLESTQDRNGKDAPLERADYREMIQTQVLEAWPKILQGLIKKATSGGCQQTKLLLGLVDFATNEPLHSSVQEREQLCDALLNKLQLHPRD